MAIASNGATATRPFGCQGLNSSRMTFMEIGQRWKCVEQIAYVLMLVGIRGDRSMRRAWADPPTEERAPSQEEATSKTWDGERLGRRLSRKVVRCSD